MTSLDKKLAWVAKIVRAGMCLGSIISLAALAHPPANRHMPQNAATCGYVDFVVGRERLSVPEPLVRLEGRDYWNLSDWAPSQAPSQAPSGLKYNAVPPETYNIFASKGEGEKPPILGHYEPKVDFENLIRYLPATTLAVMENLVNLPSQSASYSNSLKLASPSLHPLCLLLLFITFVMRPILLADDIDSTYFPVARLSHCPKRSSWTTLQ
ncbi:hypothetical protein EDD17DRAFT_1892131 [Pisolithus thermaeus]|nr:hypothetical protein EDD17DRAFT_1892131 [Pisolithus thermaeus]